MLETVLAVAYPWTKTIHVVAIITWMAGLFYLPRIYVYHAERAEPGSHTSETFKVMEEKLLRLIMNPSMIIAWIFGLALAFTPGIVDWSRDYWFHAKLVMVLGMTWFHMALARWRRTFAADANVRAGRFYRLMNEVPTLLMLGIVIMVIARPI